MLIAARALLGVAGATLMPSTMALIRTMFHDPRQMAFALSAWLTCFMGGLTIGPLIGGLVTSAISWRASVLHQGLVVAVDIVLARHIVDAPLPTTVTGQVRVGQVKVKLSAGAVTVRTGTGTLTFTVWAASLVWSDGPVWVMVSS